MNIVRTSKYPKLEDDAYIQTTTNIYNDKYYDDISINEEDINLVFDELVDCALIRELHVYGDVVPVNSDKKRFGDKLLPQHMGFGRKLVQKAFEIAIQENYNKIAVISGNGVKNYYRKFGFEDEKYFMTKTFTDEEKRNVKLLIS